jgi:hypothetical protein
LEGAVRFFQVSYSTSNSNSNVVTATEAGGRRGSQMTEKSFTGSADPVHALDSVQVPILRKIGKTV